MTEIGTMRELSISELDQVSGGALDIGSNLTSLLSPITSGVGTLLGSLSITVLGLSGSLDNLLSSVTSSLSKLLGGINL